MEDTREAALGGVKWRRDIIFILSKLSHVGL